jgi:hypothetical protein
VDLEHALGSDHNPLNSISYSERLKMSQLADFRWQRRELVLADLKHVTFWSDQDPSASIAAR